MAAAMLSKYRGWPVHFQRLFNTRVPGLLSNDMTRARPEITEENVLGNAVLDATPFWTRPARRGGRAGQTVLPHFSRRRNPQNSSVHSPIKPRTALLGSGVWLKVMLSATQSLTAALPPPRRNETT